MTTRDDPPAPRPNVWSDAEERAWLAERTYAVLRHMGGAARHILEAGRLLYEIHDRLGRVRFRRWIELEFPGSLTTAYRLMHAHRWLGEIFTHEKLSPDCVQALAAPSTPFAARRHVAAMVKAGASPDLPEIRAIIRQFRPPPKAAVQKLARTIRSRPDRKSPTDRTLELLMSILHRGEVRLCLAPAAATEDGRGRESKKPGEVLRIMVTGAGAKELTECEAEAPTLGELVRRLTGEQELVLCRVCGEAEGPKPITAFAMKRGKNSGRESACKECERKRRREGKRRKKGSEDPAD